MSFEAAQSQREWAIWTNSLGRSSTDQVEAVEDVGHALQAPRGAAFAARSVQRRQAAVFAPIGNCTAPRIRLECSSSREHLSQHLPDSPALTCPTHINGLHLFSPDPLGAFTDFCIWR